MYYGSDTVERKSELERSSWFQYSEALQKKLTIIWTDETWSNVGKAMRMSWIHKCYQVDTSNCIVCSKFLKLSSKNGK